MKARNPFLPGSQKPEGMAFKLNHALRRSCLQLLYSTKNQLEDLLGVFWNRLSVLGPSRQQGHYQKKPKVAVDSCSRSRINQLAKASTPVFVFVSVFATWQLESLLIKLWSKLCAWVYGPTWMLLCSGHCGGSRGLPFKSCMSCILTNMSRRCITCLSSQRCEAQKPRQTDFQIDDISCIQKCGTDNLCSSPKKQRT